MGNYESKDLFQSIESHDRRKVKKILKSSKTRFEYVLDDHGCPALCQAAKLGYEDIIVLLLENGYDAHVPDDRCWFAMHHAAATNNSSAIYVLVSRGHADVTRRCVVKSCHCEKQTALHAAALHGQYKAIETLIQCGCDVMATDGKGRTAREVAKRKGYKDIVDLLQRTEKLKA